MQTAALLKALGDAGRIACTQIDSALCEHGLSTAKLGVLRELVREGEPLGLGQLADRLNCGKSNVTQLVDRLEQEGLVARKPHPDDRRCMRATLTDKGLRSYELAVQAEWQVRQHLLRNLTRREQEQLATLLAKLVPKD